MMEVLSFVLLSLFSVFLYAFCNPYKQGFHTRDTSIQFPLLPLTVGLKGVILVSFICPSVVILVTEKLLQKRTPSQACKKFAFVTLVNIVVMLFFKFTAGRLRPHFLAACDPAVDMDSERFYSGTEYECRAASGRQESNARQSFYSGHASLALGAAVFLVLYVQHHYARSLIKSTCQVAVLLVGFYPGLTQVQNHWHHMSDVIAGYAAGALIAAAGYYAV